MKNFRWIVCFVLWWIPAGLPVLGETPPTWPAERPGIYDFGKVAFKSTVEAEYELVNGDTVPLVVSRIRTACGCTKVKAPKKPIMPGETLRVTVVFQAKEEGAFFKEPEIFFGHSPVPVKLPVKGIVVR